MSTENLNRPYASYAYWRGFPELQAMRKRSTAERIVQATTVHRDPCVRCFLHKRSQARFTKEVFVVFPSCGVGKVRSDVVFFVAERIVSRWFLRHIFCSWHVVGSKRDGLQLAREINIWIPLHSISSKAARTMLCCSHRPGAGVVLFAANDLPSPQHSCPALSSRVLGPKERRRTPFRRRHRPHRLVVISTFLPQPCAR